MSVNTGKTMTHWFDNALCGMFFHWGPYAVQGRGEWVMNRERIPTEEYRARFVEPWRAEACDMNRWMEAATALGASYVVLTARHHDGFALWDSRVNDFNATQVGPGRDMLAEYVEAARRHGLRVGVYYSIANWTHSDYPGAFYRDWPSEGDWADEEARARFQAYNLAEMRELMSGYGSIDYLWYDGGEPKNVRNPAMNRLARELQPGILINNRNSDDGDVIMMEQGFRKEIPEGRWEACFTLNRNWGYHETDHGYKRPEELIQMLCHTAENHGNLLLNIGPDAAGRIPPESLEVVSACGTWLKANRDWLPRSRPHSFSWSNSGFVSQAGDSVYLHLYEWPHIDLCWAEVEQPLCSAVVRPGNQPLEFEQQGARITLRTAGIHAPAQGLCTVELLFDAPPVPATESTTFWIPDQE